MSFEPFAALAANIINLLGGVLAFNRETFAVLARAPSSQHLMVAILVVLAAGLSQAIAQCTILFINRVRPLRFLFSLLINAILFVAGFLFLVVSTWCITLTPWWPNLPFGQLATGLGLSYAPLLFSFLGALPYLGVPLLSVLSIWHLLVMVIALAAIAGQGLVKAFASVALGWIVLQLLQQTVGQPIAHWGHWLANTVAGVDLVTTRQELAALLEASFKHKPSPFKQEMGERITQARQAFTRKTEPIPASALPPRQLSEAAQTGLTRGRKTVLGLLGIALVTFLTLFCLAPVRDGLFGSNPDWPELLKFFFNLLWILLIAVVVAGLLAPLETLGWWAGWYQDDIDTTTNAGVLATALTDSHSISRYLIFLDGIGKSNFEYLPDIEEFLDALNDALPESVALIRGIMPYSVLNNPLDEDRPLAFFWQLADKSRLAHPASWLGLLINFRNVWAVAVCADQRYGPLYRQGIAQIIYNGLLNNGYRPDSQLPITLIGYSGGAQMAVACAPLLKRVLTAPIEVISLGGVMSANCHFLELEHLYHLVGDKDRVERLGAVMFLGRWRIFPLSYWNQAKRRGKISFISLGPVGHQVPGGLFDPKLILSDGHSALQQTINCILTILRS